LGVWVREKPDHKNNSVLGPEVMCVFVSLLALHLSLSFLHLEVGIRWEPLDGPHTLSLTAIGPPRTRKTNLSGFGEIQIEVAFCNHE